jgi:hypothetical protein
MDDMNHCQLCQHTRTHTTTKTHDTIVNASGWHRGRVDTAASSLQPQKPVLGIWSKVSPQSNEPQQRLMMLAVQHGAAGGPQVQRVHDANLGARKAVHRCRRTGSWMRIELYFTVHS